MVAIKTQWEVFVVIYVEWSERVKISEARISQWREMVGRLSSEVDDLVRKNLSNEVRNHRNEAGTVPMTMKPY